MRASTSRREGNGRAKEGKERKAGKEEKREGKMEREGSVMGTKGDGRGGKGKGEGQLRCGSQRVAVVHRDADTSTDVGRTPGRRHLT